MENQPTVNVPEATPINPTPATVPVKTNSATPILLSILVSAVIFGLGGYYLGTQKAPTTQPVAQIQPTPTASITATPSVSISPKVGLKTYTSKYEKLSFQYPADWTLSIEQPESNLPGADALGIQDPSGKVKVIWLSAIDGLGGGCDPTAAFGSEGNEGFPCPLYEVVEKEKLANAELYYVAYVVTNDGVKYDSRFALQDQDGILTTKRTLGYFLFKGKNNGKLLAGLSGTGLKSVTKAEAQNFFTTPEASQAKYILLSASY